MTHIENNFGPIVMGDYVERQENHIDHSYNYVNQATFDVAPQNGNDAQKHEPQPLTLTERQQELFDEAVSRGLMLKTPDRLRMEALAHSARLFPRSHVLR